MQKLNAQWRNKDRPTDVLSFPQYEVAELQAMDRQARKGSIPPWVLGDVVISLDQARLQATERGVDLASELERLFIHGVVHLLGYDHEISPQEARRMRRVERYLLTR